MASRPAVDAPRRPEWLSVAALSARVDGGTLAAALLGGVAPDIDVFATHRKSCHFPVGYTVGTALAVAGLFVTGMPAFALVAAAVAILSTATGPTAEAWLYWFATLAAAYTFVRRRVSGVSARIARWLPAWLVGAVPSVYVDEIEGGITTISIRFRP